VAIGEVAHHRPHEEGAEVVTEEDGDPKRPPHDPNPLPVCDKPGGSLTKEIDGSGSLKEGHQHADAQLNGEEPDEILCAKGARHERRKPLKTLPKEENTHHAGRQKAHHRVPENECQNDSEEGGYQRGLVPKQA